MDERVYTLHFYPTVFRSKALSPERKVHSTLHVVPCAQHKMTRMTRIPLDLPSIASIEEYGNVAHFPPPVCVDTAAASASVHGSHRDSQQQEIFAALPGAHRGLLLHMIKRLCANRLKSRAMPYTNATLYGIRLHVDSTIDRSKLPCRSQHVQPVGQSKRLVEQSGSHAFDHAGDSGHDRV
nr:hypothetical protein CFP56_24518 [Quercus suber]